MRIGFFSSRVRLSSDRSPRCASKCATSPARHASRVSASPRQLVRHHQQLDVRRGLGRAQYLGVDLVELAIAPLLRAFVAEHRTARRDLQRRVLLPAFRQERARDTCGELGPQGQRIAAAVRKGVHLLRHDVGRLADRAGEDLGRLEHRQVDALEAIQAADAFERLDHGRETALLVAEDILGSAHPARRFDTGHMVAVSRVQTHN
ncbi:hypothetical protein WR25_10456 [Diploscapter pachys]|uniref:Uncharacterized protein n=1 Tax=Diploscapter pachys TaxID=2018661 RepID=A0A2A2M4S5_9BILA|nr:hypothetical protein WR25_10456 [Diploscapter pachys]